MQHASFLDTTQLHHIKQAKLRWWLMTAQTKSLSEIAVQARWKEEEISGCPLCFLYLFMVHTKDPRLTLRLPKRPVVP